MKSNDNTPTFPTQANPQQLYPKKLSRPVHPPQPLVEQSRHVKAFPPSHQHYDNAVSLLGQRPIETRPHPLQKQSTAQFPPPQPQHPSALQQNYVVAQAASAGLPRRLMQPHMQPSHAIQEPYHGGMPDLHSQGWLEEDDDDEEDMTIDEAHQDHQQPPSSFNAEKWTFQGQHHNVAGLPPAAFYPPQQYCDNYGDEIDLQPPPRGVPAPDGLMYVNNEATAAFRGGHTKDEMGFDDDGLDDGFYDDEEDDDHPPM